MSVNLNLSEIVTVRLRRDTSANWESTNPILKIGEPGLETDTKKLKFGDGVTAWTSLSYTRSDSNDPLLLESVDDRVASLIKAGSNISLNYNDSANELTVSASGLQLAGDYATLISGRVPAAQLPSYVDDVIEANNFAALPVSGETGKIYVTLDSNKVYRWSGSVYIEISPSPGSTDSVIEGSTNLYYTNSRASAAAPVQSVAGKTGTVTLAKSDVGLGNVDNTSDANKPVSTATQTALNSKAPLASPTFTGTVNGITKSMVGLGNVDNTSDANKPISSATQTALDGKASSVHTHSSDDISDATSFGKNILKAASYANINDLLWEIPAVSGSPPTFTAANGGHYYIPPSLLSLIKFNDPISGTSGDFYRVCSFDSDITLNIGNISYTNSGGIDIVRVYSTSWETIRFNNHTHAINNISELQTALDSKASSVHTHTSSDITDFSSSVSGLFPVQIAPVDLHNGGVQTAQVLQFDNNALQSVITGPTPPSGEDAKRIIVQGQRAQGGGEGGDVYVWGGDSDANGGDIKIYAGDADNVSPDSGYGGYVNIDGGKGATEGGNVEITGGYSQGGEGGSVNIVGGGTSSGVAGVVNINSNNGTWVFGADGGLTLPRGGIITDDIETVTLSGAGTVGVNQTYRKVAAGVYVGTTNYLYQIEPREAPSTGYQVRLTTLSPPGYYESEDLITWTIVSGENGGVSPVPTGVVVPPNITLSVDSSSWAFASSSSLTFPSGSIISETNNTISIMPPTAQSGQSLVVRPTAAIWAISSSNYIEYGNPITIVVTLGSWAYFGTVNYTISGTGVTPQSLGRALTGKLTFVSTSGPDAESITWTIPANSNITEFTLTLTSVDGTRSIDQEVDNDPILYYDFEESNGMPIGQFITVTNNGISSSEHSHVHLVAGNPSTVDIYLGDDDQYIKIEKNAGDVIIGTNSDTNHWTFGTDGGMTFPDGSIQTTAYPGNANISTCLLHEYADPSGVSTPTSVAIDGMSYGGGQVVVDSAFGLGSSRVTLYSNSMFAMVAVDADIDTVYYNGESGSDGSGDKSLSVGVSNYRGYYSYHNLISGDDPAIQQIVISKSSIMSGSNRSIDTNNDDFTVTGLSGSDVIIVLNLYWNNYGGPDYSNSTTVAIQQFIDLVMFDDTTPRTNINDIRTAFYDNSATIKTAIENENSDLLVNGFEFYRSFQKVTPSGGSGSGAVLEIEVYDNGGYDDEDVLVRGTGYQINDTLTVTGDLLGGTTPANDVTITVNGINEAGGIIGYSVDGTSINTLWPDSYIIDGDDDQYDIGNFIGTNRTRSTAMVTLAYDPIEEDGNGGDDVFQILTILSADKTISEGQWVWFEEQNQGAFINYTLSTSGLNSSDISDFSSAVSELLPVKNVVQGSGVSVTSSGGTFTVGVSGLNSSYISDFNSSVNDRVGNLLIAGDNIDLDYITDPASLTVSIDPTFLNTSLVAGNGISLDYADDQLTVNISGLDASYISDFSSAVSTATQTALNSKAPLASPTFTGTVNGITKSMVGLGNVDNTSDANKPISTAQQTALDGKASSNHNHVIGDVTDLQTALDSKQASGNYATLTDGKVPSSQLPSYVDDVIEAANLAALPVSGETSKIYVTLDSNKVYRWSGSAYVEISPSPGSTDSVIEGSTNLYYTNSRASAAAPVQSVSGKTGTVTLAKSDVGLGNVDNTSDDNKPISSATQTALDGKASSVHTHTSSNISNFNESVNDRVGDLLVAGDNISLEYINSPASLTVSIVPTFLNTSLVAGSGISLSYANSELTVKVSGLNSSYISDFSSAVSTATQTALNSKAPLASPTFTGTVNGITKSMVGLGNVDNTSDANKPISTAQQTALDGKASSSHNHAISDVTGLQTALDNTGSSPDAGLINKLQLATTSPTVVSTTLNYTGPNAVGFQSKYLNFTSPPTSGLNGKWKYDRLPGVYNLFTGVTISGVGGQFSCNALNGGFLRVGQQLTISGTLAGTGTITGYANPTIYLIGATNGATTFTLTTVTGAAIVTTTGTPTGLTYTLKDYLATNVAVTDTSGGLSCAITALRVGQTLRVAGTSSGTGSIAAGDYFISETNGSTTFRVINQNTGFTPVTTVAGTTTGLTFSILERMNFSSFNPYYPTVITGEVIADYADAPKIKKKNLKTLWAVITPHHTMTMTAGSLLGYLYFNLYTFDNATGSPLTYTNRFDYLCTKAVENFSNEVIVNLQGGHKYLIYAKDSGKYLPNVADTTTPTYAGSTFPSQLTTEMLKDPYDMYTDIPHIPFVYNLVKAPTINVIRITGTDGTFNCNPLYIAGGTTSYLANGQLVMILGAFANGIIVSPPFTAGNLYIIDGTPTIESNGTVTFKLKTLVGDPLVTTLTTTTLSNVAITGTAGQFSCASSFLKVGQTVTISGTLGGTGSITGYSSPTTYVIGVTNTTTTGTLFTTAGAAIATTAGTPTGLTYTSGYAGTAALAFYVNPPDPNNTYVSQMTLSTSTSNPGIPLGITVDSMGYSGTADDSSEVNVKLDLVY